MQDYGYEAWGVHISWHSCAGLDGDPVLWTDEQFPGLWDWISARREERPERKD